VYKKSDGLELGFVGRLESLGSGLGLAVGLYGRLRGTVVERRSLAGELFLSHARPAADGWVTTIVGKLPATGQPTRPTQTFILSGR